MFLIRKIPKILINFKMRQNKTKLLERTIVLSKNVDF